MAVLRKITGEIGTASRRKTCNLFSHLHLYLLWVFEWAGFRFKDNSDENTRQRTARGTGFRVPRFTPAF